MWYDTTAQKLKRSNGTAWNIVGDETSSHQGDISLANVAEKSVDSLVDGATYKKYLNTERTKLTGVETGADVTGSHTAADTALVDTETAANIHIWADDPGARVNTETTLLAAAKLYGAVDYKYVTYENSISTTSQSYITLSDMLITHTCPKCIALFLSVTRLDTQTGSADAAYNIFHESVEGSTIGMWSGIEAGHKQICTNMLIWPMAAGEHSIRIQWKCLNGNTIYCTQRRLSVLFWKVE